MIFICEIKYAEPVRSQQKTWKKLCNESWLTISLIYGFLLNKHIFPKTRIINILRIYQFPYKRKSFNSMPTSKWKYAVKTKWAFYSHISTEFSKNSAFFSEIMKLKSDFRTKSLIESWFSMISKNFAHMNLRIMTWNEVFNFKNELMTQIMLVLKAVWVLITFPRSFPRKFSRSLVIFHS